MKTKFSEILMATFAAVAFWSASAWAEKVTLAGSSTILPIMEEMSPLFAENGFTLRIQGGGTSAGLKSVRMGMAEIGMVSRSLSEDEAKQFKHIKIGTDWVVLIAHKTFPRNDLTSAEVVELYTKKSAQIDERTVHVIAKEAGRATKEVFDGYFKIGDQLRKDLIIIGANGQAIASVARDKDAVGYVAYNAVYEAMQQGEPIKMLSLDGVAGTPENVSKGAYPLTRQLNLAYLPGQSKLIERFKPILTSDRAVKVFQANDIMPAL